MRKLVVLCALVLCASAGAAIPSSERQALTDLYQATNGAQWTDKSNWLTSEPECTWYGVQCDESQSNVTHLYLYADNLVGTIPASIRNLTKLEELHIYDNDLRGPLTPEIGQLAELQVLYADRSKFTGTIPHQYGALTKLRVLGLSGNELTGAIPIQLGDLTALEELNLSYNQLSETIPDLSRLTSLTSLDLSANALTGTIPPTLGSLTSVERISLSTNQLAGAIPSALAGLTQLSDLDLSINKLTGGIPASLSQLEKLERFNLRGNLLSDPLPSTMGDFTALKFLDVAENDLTGEIPASLYRLTQLETLNLGDNAMTGPISPQIAGLTSLQELALYFNQFSGTIPVELTTIAPLRSLELQKNQLTGAIPPELSRLTNLTYLDVSDNQLTGSIPNSLGDLSKLEYFFVNENDLAGTIPPELGRLTNLIILSVASNHLTGTIPDALRSLTKLEQFYANGNELTGSIPSWIGEWTNLGALFLGDNKLSGTLPAALSTLEGLLYFDVSFNQFSGPLFDFSRLGNLVYIDVEFNELSGPIPASIGALRNMDFAVFGNNHFSGPLPREIGGMTNVTYFELAENELEGAIPPEIAQLKKAYNIDLHGNRLSGALPRELGTMTDLQSLSVSFNALTGAIPAEVKSMTTLVDKGGLDFAYNGLFTEDASVRDFVNQKSYEDFQQTQTVMPKNIRLVETTDRSATFSFEPIAYSYYGGGYQVVASTTVNGAPAVVGTTSSKEVDSITVRGLAPSTTYFFTVATVSHPIPGQKNLVVSERSAPIQGTTKQRVVAPAEVVITDEPSGLVQIDGVEVEADSFTVTNFGDVATQITLEKSEDDFFTVSPTQFALAGGASQKVTLHSNPKPPSTYYGWVGVSGQGAPGDLGVGVILLSSTRPPGRVVATPVITRIEVAGAPGSDQVGTAQFRNTGTARLTGIVVSDQPWVTVPAEPVTIDPGSVGTVNFRIVRSRRPSETEGGLVANLTLVYVTGSDALTYKDVEFLDATNVSTSKVTIVDVTKPPVSNGPIPSLSSGEIAYLIPGVATLTGSHADVSIINAAGATAISDLKLYFTSSAQTSIASMQPLGFAKAVSLPNLVSSVYGNATGSGTLQVRSSGQSQSLVTAGKVTAVTDSGTYTGAIPVFRSDRIVAPNNQLYLAGVSAPGDLVIQETGSGATNVRVFFRDAAGNATPSTDYPIASYGLLELTNAVPANAVTAVIRNLGGGTILAYARARDASGDPWSIVDWNRFYQFSTLAPVRIPYADGGQTGTRRRSVRTNAITASAATDVVLFNPGTVESRATLTAGGGSSRTVTIAPNATVTIANAGAGATTPAVSILVTPQRGELVVTARSHSAKGGSALPVLPATAGLRLGQSQIFANLDDSSSVRTSYGLTESGGATVKVRASIIIDETSPLTATVTSRTFTLAPGGQVFLPELVRSFAGDQRDTLFGDLHNLTLEFDVVEGNGSVVPFVIETDIASGDTNVVVQ